MPSNKINKRDFARVNDIWKLTLANENENDKLEVRGQSIIQLWYAAQVAVCPSTIRNNMPLFAAMFKKAHARAHNHSFMSEYNARYALSLTIERVVPSQGRST